MPQIKFKHVVSFSSEDRNFPAENLLKDGQFLKWKCGQSSDKSAFVVLQFEKAEEIHAIDVGNECSAFVEVLVNRSGCKQDFEVLLVTSAFMSPTESKSSSNLNRVRMFTRDKFTQNIANEKWDLVKIVCTQPFNKALKFGLSFIKFHSPPNDLNENKSPNKLETSLRLGVFKLKDDVESTKVIKPGSLFANRRDSSQSQVLTSAAAIRDASNKLEESLQKGGKISPILKPTNNAALKAALESKKAKNNSPSVVKTQKPVKTPKKTPPKQNEPPTKRQKTINTKEKPISSHQNHPFDKIMSGVVFALSGFQNPHRAELREKALEMGAKYRPDWDTLCTHLVCAFVNTPKFIQVQGKGGRIVSKEWIVDCYTKKKKLSWKLYRMSKSGPDTDSEDDSHYATSSTNSKQNSLSSDNITSTLDSDEDTSLINSSAASETQPLSSDECDTEEEINKVNKNEKNIDSRHLYDADTDVEDECAIDSANGFSVSDLPDYFNGCHFFLYGDFDAAMRRLLTRYIVAFKGLIEDYMNDKVQYVITQKSWDENFDEALKENDKLTFVKPTWIFACRDNGKLVSHQRHVIESV